MTRITTPARHAFLATLFAMASSLLLLSGCGGGGGNNAPPPPPPITASPGYFDNVSALGGADVFSDAANTTPLHIADLQAMVNGNQFTLVSVANNLAYYATITSLTGNNYTANVAIYQNNVPYGNTTVSGTLVAGTSIAGTFATTGTGLGRGTFSLEYSLANTPVAAISRIVRDNSTTPIAWLNNTPVMSVSSFQIDSTGALQNIVTTVVGYFTGCNITGTVTPVSNTALYQVSMTLTNCTTPAVNGSYAGLATSRTQSTNDDRMVVTVTSGTNSMNGEFH